MAKLLCLLLLFLPCASWASSCSYYDSQLAQEQAWLNSCAAGSSCSSEPMAQTQSDGNVWGGWNNYVTPSNGDQYQAGFIQWFCPVGTQPAVPPSCKAGSAVADGSSYSHFDDGEDCQNGCEMALDAGTVSGSGSGSAPMSSFVFTGASCPVEKGKGTDSPAKTQPTATKQPDGTTKYCDQISGKCVVAPTVSPATDPAPSTSSSGSGSTGSNAGVGPVAVQALGVLARAQGRALALVRLGQAAQALVLVVRVAILRLHRLLVVAPLGMPVIRAMRMGFCRACIHRVTPQSSPFTTPICSR